MTTTFTTGSTVSFEPNTPGVSRPPTLSTGYSTSSRVYTQNGKNKLLQLETYGYSILDLSNPLNPTALVYDFLINEGFTTAGDGSSYVYACSVSGDGKYLAMSLGDPQGSQWGTIYFTPNGDAWAAQRNNNVGNAWASAFHIINGRYLNYEIQSGGQLFVTDVTSITSGTNGPFNTSFPTEKVTSVSGITNFQIIGNYLVYGTATGISVVDISHPGSVGSISSSFTKKLIASSYFGGRTLTGYVTGALDTADPTKIWLLVELAAPGTYGAQTGTFGYTLLSVTGGTNVSPLGPIWNAPFTAGNTYTIAGNNSAVVNISNNLYVFMATTQSSPAPAVFSYYAIAVSDWANILTTVAPIQTFTKSQFTGATNSISTLVDNTSNTVYFYLPTGEFEFVFPVTVTSSSTGSTPPSITQLFTIETPITYQPFPSGPAGPRDIGNVFSPACLNEGKLYNVSGVPRLIEVECWGYSTYDLSNKESPSVICWDFLIGEGFFKGGDGQSYVANVGVSQDGARVALTMNGPGELWGTLYGIASGSKFSIMRSGNTYGISLIKQYNSRYICYQVGMGQYAATDITDMPAIVGFPGSSPEQNISTEVINIGPAYGVLGAPAVLVGNYIVFSNNSGGITIIDVSNPGPIGSIGQNFKTTIIPNTFNYFNGNTVGSTTAYVDSSNPNKIWVLTSLTTPPASSTTLNKIYGLFYVTQDPISGVFSTPVGVGSLFVVPSTTDGAWRGAASQSVFFTKNNTIFILLDVVQLGTNLSGFIGTTTDLWGTAYQPVTIFPAGILSSYPIGTLDNGTNTVDLYTITAVTPITFSSSIPPITTATVPLNVSVDTISTTSAVLHASTPTSVGAGVNYYNIYVNGIVRTNSINPYFPFTLLSLSPNTAYSIQVSLVDTNNVEGTKSDVISFTTSNTVSASAPSAPLNVNATTTTDPTSIAVTWAAPTQINGTLVGYKVTNKVTSAINNISATSLQTTVSGLSYGVPYTFGVIATNNVGDSGESVSNSITLVTPVNPPSIPTNISIGINSLFTTVTWNPPTSTGDGPVTQYLITLNNNKSAPVITQLVDANTFSYSITGLQAGTLYSFSIEATNSTSFPYVYGPPGLSIQFDPAIQNSGKTLVKNNFNYVNFYEAPIILDKTDPDYGSFLYPETVTNPVYSLITNSNLTIPVIFTNSLNAIAIRYQSTTDSTHIDYYIPLNKLIYTSFHDLTKELQDSLTVNATQYYPFEVVALTDDVSGINTLIFRALTLTQTFAPTSQDPIINGQTYINANNIIFGTNPTLFEGYEEYLVENYIPTPEYDNLNHKALVESMPIVPRSNLFVTYKLPVETKPYPTIEKAAVNYTITVDNIPLWPKKVNIFWYDINNQYTHLIDYNGDGVLLQKIRTIDEFGNVTYTYNPDLTVTPNGYGTVNYSLGTITNLSLPNYRNAAIVGSGATFPIAVYSVKTGVLALNIRGTIQNINIPIGSYSAESLINYLNDPKKGNLKSYGLEAGYRNGQVYIINNLTGPDQTLTLNGVPAGTLALSIFGFNPIVISPPPIYISYYYSLNQNNKLQYIWYQTPHFTIKVNNRTDASPFTQSHLAYILAKTQQFKPATSVLDGISINIPITDTAMVSETFDFKIHPSGAEEPITLPYIIVWVTPPADATTGLTPGVPLDIKVENPDDQYDIKTGSFTYAD